VTSDTTSGSTLPRKLKIAFLVRLGLGFTITVRDLRGKGQRRRPEAQRMAEGLHI
jgi:hypothetical protein